MAEPPAKLKKGLLSRPNWARTKASAKEAARQAGPPEQRSKATSSIYSEDRPHALLSQTLNISSSSSARAPRQPSIHASSASRLQPAASSSNRVSEAALVATLLAKVSTKLPIHSTTLPSTLERDQDVSRACTALQDIAKAKLSLVAVPLLSELDSLTKPPYHSDSDFLSLDLLRSQLFLLALLTRCLHSHWASHSLHKHSPTASTSAVKIQDPTPLADALARQLLDLAVAFIRAHKGQDDELNPINAGLACDGLVGADTTVGFLAQSALKKEMATQRGIRQASELAVAAPTIFPSRQSASTDLIHHAAQVIYFLSASNFGTVLSRIKSRVLHPAGSDELPSDSSEMRVLECCCLDRRRASLVIQELCNTFIHLKRPLQASVSAALHRALSSFISAASLEFAALTATNRRLEGGPEVLFDIIYTLSEGSKKKEFCWPVMASLLALCPDIVAKLVIGEGARSPGVTKKVQFLDALRKTLKGKSSEVAAICYSDLARAAGYLEPDDEDPSALQLLVADFELDLKTALFDPRKPFAPDSLTTSDLTIRTLVALYRLNPSSVIESVFVPLLRTDAHDKLKAAALGAVLVLFNEGSVAPWTPGPLALLSTISKPMRQLFLDTSTLPLTPPSRRPSSRAHHTPTRSSHEQVVSSTTRLIHNILLIWTADPRFLVHGVFRPPPNAPSNQPGANDSLGKVLIAVASLMEVEHAREVRCAAAGMLFRLLGETGEEVVSARDGPGFEAALLPVSWAISKFVLEAAASDELLAARLLSRNLQRLRVIFARPQPASLVDLVSQSSSWSAHWTSIDISLLIQLNSADRQVRSLALESLQLASLLLDDFGSLVGHHVRTTISVLASAMISQKDQWEQQQLAAALGAIEEPSPGLVAAWDEAMRRWKALSTTVFARNTDSDDEAEEGHRREASDSSIRSSDARLEEWTSLGGFLLATSGICVEPTGLAPLEAVIPASRYPARFFRRADRPRQAERLVQELVDLLVADSLEIRDAVREMLGNHLSSHQLPPFVSLLDQISRHFQDNGVPVTEDAFTLFIMQTISVLHLIFARESSHSFIALPSDTTSTLYGLLNSFALYLSRLEQGEISYRRMIRLAQLCEIVFKRQSLTDSVERNALLFQLVVWGSGDAADASDAFEERLHDELRQELHIACLQAMVPLLDGLVIHSPDALRGEIDTQLVKRYFNFLTLSLHRLDASSTTSDAVKSVIVSALANLLGANLSAARAMFGATGLASGISDRAVYLNTLARMADTGVRFDEFPLAAADDTFEKLVELLRQPGPLAIALCHVASAAQFEDLIEIFFKVFSSRKTISRFLKDVIEMEVSVTDHESTLFRGNSFATRILTVYARSRGYHYLRDTLKDLLLTLCQKPPEFSMDFDPHRQTAADDTASRNLEQVTEAFLVCISQSIDQVPLAIREICSHIGEVVGERFPESVFTAIGGFIFLRFINPAIVSPETIDLDLPQSGSGENREIRRGLVMITKVLQALANNVRFGSKEPGMKKLNEFCDVQVFAMTRFLQAISHYSPAEEALEMYTDEDDESESTLTEADRSFLHQFLSDHSEKLGLELLRGKHAELRYGQEGESSPSTTGQATWAQVTDLIAALGPPPEAAARLAAAEWEKSTEQAYTTFITRNELRAPFGTRDWESVFYEMAGKKNGNITFCLILERIKADDADLESLSYFILDVLSKAQEPFEILIDATNFADTNEVAPLWIAQLIAIAPASVSQQLARVVIFSANPTLRRYLRRLGRSMSFENIDTRRILAISTLSDLEQQFEKPDQVLPSQTVLLAREKRSQFTQITERHHHQVRAEHPVVLRLGTDTLVISTAKRQELFLDVRAVLNDFIQLRDIEEIRLVSMGAEGDGFAIKVAGERVARRFLTSLKREDLFQALVKARQAAPSRPSTFVRGLTPESAMAVTLNAILVNLSSSTELIRSSAYQLLTTVVRSHHVGGFEDLRSQEGVHVPSGHLSFLTTVSERLAAAFPAFALDVVGQISASLHLVSSHESSAYIHCLRPWIHHLSSVFQFTPRSERESNMLKMRTAIRQLVRAAIREPTIHATLASRIWPTVGKLDFLLPMVLEETVRLAMSFEAGSDSDPTAQLGEILVALAAGQALHGKIIAQLRYCITRTALRPVLALDQSLEWPEITALVRLDLPLSFDTKPHLYLPELFHIFVSLCGNGSLSFRRCLYALLLNTISLLDLLEADDSVRGITDPLCGERGREVFRLDDSRSGWDIVDDGDALVRALLGVLEVASPSLDTVNAWRARWTSLATAACFQHNPALQARQFLVLGYLGAASIDGDLVFQILTTLRSAIRLSPSSNEELPIGIIRTLAACLPGMIHDSPFWSGLGGLSIALLQIGHPRITAAAVPLLSAVLDGMQQGGYFNQRPLVETFLDFREDEGPDSTANALDELAGVDTEIHLSASLATLLVDPLLDPQTSASTITLLLQLLRCARLPATPNGTTNELITVEEDAIPFFLLLLPILGREGRFEELLEAAGLDSEILSSAEGLDLYRTIALRLGVMSRDGAFFAVSLIVALAQDAEDPLERTVLFAILERLAISHPDVARTFYVPLAPILTASISSPTSSDLELEAVQAVLRLQDDTEAADHPTADQILDQLHELGLPALAHVGLPLSDQTDEITLEQIEISHLAADLLSRILVLGS